MTNPSPIPLPDAPTQFGSHYHKMWRRCRRLWWLSEHCPHPEGGTGLRPRESPSPLLIGLFTHAGLEHLRRGYLAEHKYDIDRAVALMEGHAVKYRPVAGDHFDDDLATARQLLIGYYDWYLGPVARDPDDFELVSDDEGPLVEREFRTLLHTDEGRPVEFTCRVDLVARWHGWLSVIEYKTTDVSWAGRLFQQMRVDAQATGEVFTLRRHFPDWDLAGVVVDALLKRASKKDPYKRDMIDRPDAALRAFEQEIVQDVSEIERQQRVYRERVEAGASPLEAAERAFPRDGTFNGACFQYNRACDFLRMCANPDEAERELVHFRPRSPAEERFRVRTEDVPL